MAVVPNLIPIFPTPPDFLHCNTDLGLFYTSDCQLAGQGLLVGNQPVQYSATAPDARYRLPLRVTHGTCTILVQLAGPAQHHASPFAIIPDVIRGMAGAVIQQCTGGRPMGWNGGYITNGMGVIQRHLNDYQLIPSYQPSGAGLRFITVTVKNVNLQEISPGDTDARIPWIFANGLINSGGAGDDHIRTVRYERAQIIHNRGLETLGGGGIWWQPGPIGQDEMTYECDASLGNPASVDCSQLQYQGFGNPSDSIQVGPRNSKSFFSNSCGLTVTAAVPVVLLISQIADAFAALLGTCIEVPISSPHGGRAYYGVHPTPSSINIQDLFGPSKKKRDASGVSGLNALPLHVNMTIFAHASSAKISCEEQAAEQRRPLTSCETA